jgi:hypothetical protein
MQIFSLRTVQLYVLELYTGKQGTPANCLAGPADEKRVEAFQTIHERFEGFNMGSVLHKRYSCMLELLYSVQCNDYSMPTPIHPNQPI